ncbi:MAG: hypothetical protein ABI434_13325 [Burkholderiaceae bacterium]
MKIESTVAPKTGRITGTLHRRGYAQPAPLQDEDLPREKAEASEVAGQPNNSRQKDPEGAR